MPRTLSPSFKILVDYLLGSMSPESLREKLKDAARRKDKRSLDKVISECVAAGIPELDDDIQKARRTSDILKGGTGG